MNGALIEIIILAALAGFLFLRLREVLGRRTGHEDPAEWMRESSARGPEPDDDSDKVVRFPGAQQDSHDDVAAITDKDGPIGLTLIDAKQLEPDFDARRFMDGARTAYEMIVMAFETGDKETLGPLLSDDVLASFEDAIDQRRNDGLSVDARFIGLRDARVEGARLDEDAATLEIDTRFDAEMIVSVRNAEGEVVEGDPAAVRRMNDLWTFRRTLGANDPSWVLVETGE